MFTSFQSYHLPLHEFLKRNLEPLYSHIICNIGLPPIALLILLLNTSKIPRVMGVLLSSSSGRVFTAYIPDSVKLSTLSPFLKSPFWENGNPKSSSSSHYANNYCNIYITSIGSTPDISESSTSSIGMLRPDRECNKK